MREIQYTAFHPSYRTLYDLVGEDAMIKIYQEFKGTQLQLPMRLYDRTAVAAELNGKSVDARMMKKYSQMYGFTPRWIKNAMLGRDVSMQSGKRNIGRE